MGVIARVSVLSLCVCAHKLKARKQQTLCLNSVSALMLSAGFVSVPLKDNRGRRPLRRGLATNLASQTTPEVKSMRRTRVMCECIHAGFLLAQVLSILLVVFGRFVVRSGN